MGVAIGAGAGTFGGMLYDLGKLGVGEDYLGEVGQHLQAGKVAVVAEVGEEWVTPVDTSMEAVGGVVFRRARGEVVDSQIERDAAALKAEVADLKAEHARAARRGKRSCKRRSRTAKAKLQATQDRAKAAGEATKREMEAKVKSLKDAGGQGAG